MCFVYGKGMNDMPWGWASENEWNKKVYQLWCNRLRCCYCKKFLKTKKGKYYKDCTVCERWLTLSNFVDDVPKIDGYDRERFLNGELELDKDIKSNGAKKIYCMEECTFVTHDVNIKQAHKTRDNSKFQGENNPMYGKHFSDEHKQKLSEANKGKHHTEETKRKISENHGMKGKLGSECPNSKRVGQYDKKTKELIKIWDSMMDVQRELGINSGNISRCCKGKLKSTGGFIWKYV